MVDRLAVTFTIGISIIHRGCLFAVSCDLMYVREPHPEEDTVRILLLRLAECQVLVQLFACLGGGEIAAHFLQRDGLVPHQTVDLPQPKAKLEVDDDAVHAVEWLRAVEVEGVAHKTDKKSGQPNRRRSNWPSPAVLRWAIQGSGWSVL